MNREQTIEAIRVMQAYVDGKEVQFRVDDGWKGTFIPLWQWHTEDYRIKPTRAFRPWTADEVPLGSQCRTQGDTKRFLIVRTSDESTRDEWLNKCEHSTDGGKTWLPCGVVEEAK
jgi:hypothetical protein